MRVMITAALAGLFLFVAPVMATVDMHGGTKRNETIIYKTTADGTWPFKIDAAPVIYFDI